MISTRNYLIYIYLNIYYYNTITFLLVKRIGTASLFGNVVIK